MKSFDAWRDEYEVEIEYLKSRGRRSLFRINEKMSHETATDLETYFTKKGYKFEKRKCNTCGGFDIIIFWG